MEHARENPYEGASEGRWSNIAIIVLVALMLAGCAWCAWRVGNKNGKATTYKEQYLPGQPLDAVKLSAPSWSDMEYMYRVGDRTSGACWYRVHVDGRWEVYLICEGRSYVDQHLKSEVSE